MPGDCSPARVTILVAEEDPLLRCLLAERLSAEHDFEVVAAAANGGELLAALSNRLPDVVLLDLTLPTPSGMRVVEALAAQTESSAILILGDDDSEATQLEAARHGARGFLPRSGGADGIVQAIRTIARGDLWFPHPVLHRILREYSTLIRRAREQERPAHRLTDRERQVLIRVARGMTNNQIARDLYMSVHTVKLQVQNILRKLDLPNRTEAAVFALREGLLDPPTECDAAA
jgi:DNA-binding NarL/FixJ family response regulator